MTLTLNTVGTTRFKLLIVEDEGVIAMDLRLRLDHLGYRVVGIAATGTAAIELAGRELLNVR